MNVPEALLSSILNYEDMACQLGKFQGTPSAHTRWPAPPGAGYPLALVSPPMGGGDQDFLTAKNPIVLRNIVFHGQQPDHFHIVNDLAQMAYNFYHRNRFAISVCGYHVINILASQPQIAPTSDENLYGQMVMLSIYLQRL